MQLLLDLRDVFLLGIEREGGLVLVERLLIFLAGEVGGAEVGEGGGVLRVEAEGAFEDVGGGFGAKFILYPEEVAISAASLLLNRPVKWIEDRREHFMASIQERDQYWDLEIAVDADARIIGVRGQLIHDTGAYVPWGIVLPWITATTVPGPYVIPHLKLDVLSMFTNKVQTTPVRGAGRPEAVTAMERLMDRVARELKLDRAEVRARNLIAAEKMPYAKPLKSRGGQSVVLAVGASMGANAAHLVDLAIMGSAMASIILGLDRPTVGLLNVGTEEIKGVEEVKDAAQILRDSSLPGLTYAGFVEGDGIGRGDVDVVVTDGFTGNVALKTLEGTMRTIVKALFTAIGAPEYKEHADAIMPALLGLYAQFDPDTYGGAILLGTDDTFRLLSTV